MIFDHIDNIERYKNDEKLYPELLKIKAIREGKTDTGIRLSEIVTHPIAESKLETHKKFIDIQFVISGEELVLIDSVEGCKVEAMYSDEKDFALYSLSETYSTLYLRNGWFAVIYPGEGHAPSTSVSLNESGHSVKGVIKVKA